MRWHLLLCIFSSTVDGWRQFKHWNDAQWCNQTVDPLWPFAYSKHSSLLLAEPKGRVASNLQNMGHECALRGVRSKCHRCEIIRCGATLSDTCDYQLQGVDYPDLDKNQPTTIDTPWAVGATVTHRHDFGAAERVCVMLTGGSCIQPLASVSDFSPCAVRCWGASAAGTRPQPYTHGWTYDSQQGLPQGRVYTLAGSAGRPGYVDGSASSARFRAPQGVTMDRAGNTYVCDTGNHVVRIITAAGQVGTVAGSGREGYADGLGKSALFSSPVGISLIERCVSGSGVDLGPVEADGTGPGGAACASYRPSLVVADTGNHRIRVISDVHLWSSAGGSSAVVGTVAGGGNTTDPSTSRPYSEDLEQQAHGLSDGQGHFARFDSPLGVASDNAGNIFVADTRNHLIRWVNSTGYVRTLAGTVQAQRKPLPGCPHPCLQGVHGYMDGALNSSRFSSPSGITLGPGGRTGTPWGGTVVPYTLLITDADRVRIITSNGVGAGGQIVPDWGASITLPGTAPALHASPSDILSWSRVYTLAGSMGDGQEDGEGREARFDQPRGIVASQDGRVYVADSSRCRIRRVSVVAAVARPLTCTSRLVDIVQPSGCGSYDPPVDSTGRTHSPWEAHVQYRANMSNVLVAAQSTASGRLLRKCVGVPPPDVTLQANGTTESPTGGTLSQLVSSDDDEGQGTEMLLACPSGCAAAASAVWGGDPGLGVGFFYHDASSICKAAVHAGAIQDSTGGYVTITFQKGVGPEFLFHPTYLTGGAGSGGVTAQGLASVPATLRPIARTFSVAIYSDPWNSTITHTIAGRVSSSIGGADGACGHVDGQPPLSTSFRNPTSLTLFKGWAGVADQDAGRHLVVADTGNHVVRAVTAVCTFICENGGVCTGPDVCTCEPGWAGLDCTTPVCTTACTGRSVCTGPDECTCPPGYTGAGCTQALCVQTCRNGGTCSSPDTCTCLPGWFDANCTTPVCAQTCGNGGNCTAPDTCTCPEMWTGADCRTPVCTQPCSNGGVCTAPNTCTCTPSWSGHDCSKPVCHQGFFRRDPYPQGYSLSTWRQPSWKQFVPCTYSEWCASTNEFICAQRQSTPSRLALPRVRNITGKGDGAEIDSDRGALDLDSPAESRQQCVPLEIGINLRTPYRVEMENGSWTGYWRNTPLTPYGWGPTETSNPWSSPGPAVSDRQVVQAIWADVPQGVYVCANGGNCTAPDTCTCAPGWVGFDCRIPVCLQGYYNPVAIDPRYPGNQGMYRGSERTLTIWESPASFNGKHDGYIHDHPNFHSKPEDMVQTRGYEVTHTFFPGPRLQVPPEFNKWEGWRLDGVWRRQSATVQWLPGFNLHSFNRSCPFDRTGRKSRDLRPGAVQNIPVDDPFPAFEPRLVYSDAAVNASGRWSEEGGECVDRVVLGCYNGGQCVGPNTCECAPGWEGADCSLPICSNTVSTVFAEALPPQPTSPLDGQIIRPTLLRDPSAWPPVLPLQGASGVLVIGGAAGPNMSATLPRRLNYGIPPSLSLPDGMPALPGDRMVAWRRCANNGNCSRPDVCTCEKGWSGADCRTPICAQDCMNGGTCVAPDTCECAQRPSAFVDRRGRPLYQKPNGEAQSTGWTGFDCNTPICVQAKEWVPIDTTGSSMITLLPLANTPIRNDGAAFQVGCPGGGDYIDEGQRTRVNLKLCNNDVWWQGNYEQSWANGDVDDGPLTPNPSLRSPGRSIRINHPNYLPPPTQDARWIQGPAVPGEGLYACQNFGACVFPDFCLCPDGWSGFDCSIPTCEYATMYQDPARPGVPITVQGCLHGGVCYGVNECACPNTTSLLPAQYPLDAIPTDSITGWTGSDCSMAICAQGFFDPECRFVPPGLGGVSQMAEGCYRCSNGGNCTAPDTCTCPPEWSGYDCRAPVCVQHATEDTIKALATLDEQSVVNFEQDPCGSRFDLVEVNDELISRGNCTRPNTCTCLCIVRALRGADGALDDNPWRDPLNRPLPPGTVFGNYDCLDGFEGNLNSDGTFSSCHLRIKVPSPLERNSHIILIIAAILFGASVPAFFAARRYLRKKMLEFKAERRRARREEEAAEKEEKAKVEEKAAKKAARAKGKKD